MQAAYTQFLRKEVFIDLEKVAEDYIMEYSKQYNLNYTILRYGSLYGPRSPKNNGVRKIIEKAIKSKQLLIMEVLK